MWKGSLNKPQNTSKFYQSHQYLLDKEMDNEKLKKSSIDTKEGLFIRIFLSQ